MSSNILRSDAHLRMDVTIANINSISVDSISEIEKELEPYDTVSLVFLLYDIPDTALQRLIVYQRVYKDIEGNNNTTLIYDWAVHSQSELNWKYKFLEALAICQLYGIIRKLGFQVPIVKQYYSPDKNNFSVHINPFKKALYKICENTDSDTFFKLKKTLLSFGINTTDYEFCELLLLELMSQKFLNINQYNTNTDKESGIDTFAKIIERFHTLKHFAKELREIEAKVNGFENKQSIINTADDIVIKSISSISDDNNAKSEHNMKSFDNFDDIYNIINQIDESNLKNLKSDTKKTELDAYAIQNSGRVGTCLIINQEKFHPSKDSIQNDEQTEPLEDRVGSSKDKKILEKTMTALNFKVIAHDNLSANEMCLTIRDVVKHEVDPLDSIFMLCILSHGVRGHVYGANSVKVGIDDVQNILDSKDAKLLHKIPKVLIIQACQVNSDQPIAHKLVADSPSQHFHVRKSLFFIFWATAPEFEAYRYGEKGSFFIHILCKILEENVETEHFADMCTKVNRCIRNISEKLKINQVSEYKSSLSKKLYLRLPS